jgi:hypothetical protein
VNIASSIARNRHEESYIQIIKTNFWNPHHFLPDHPVSALFDAYRTHLRDSVKEVSCGNDLHLPTLLDCIVPESITMIDLFDDQIQKAAKSIQDNMSKESALPDVGKLEAELEEQRTRLMELREKRVSEEKTMVEKFRKSELIRVEQERIGQEKLEKANTERIVAEEQRIALEQKSEARLRVETEKANAARFEVEQQKIEFHKERIELQNKNFEEISDSVSEASDLDVEEHDGWANSLEISSSVAATNSLEDDAEQETIVEQVSNAGPVSTQEDDNISEFSDFSLELED